MDFPENIKKEFASLSREQCMEILGILIQHGVEYTKNENGVFFSWEDLSSDTRVEIGKVINFGHTQRQNLEEIERRIEGIREK